MPRHHLLLINPWITDVAAYDLWAWPLGLLYWAARLRRWGFAVTLLDCTDRAHPALGKAARPSRRFHTGKYHTEPFEPSPEPARLARRQFRRYGLPPEAFDHELEAFEQNAGCPPDAILIASRMTYWYHGVAEAIARCRRRWPGKHGAPRPPILLGGVYATLCPEHARAHSGADLVLEGAAFGSLPAWLRERFPALAERIDDPSPDPETWLRPAFDLCHGQGALPLLTSVGCPFDCSYCASRNLVSRHLRRCPDSVFREVCEHHERWGTHDFAFYDDALLVDAERCFEPFLDRLIEASLGLRLHTPNGMHYVAIAPRLARKMKTAGVETVRLSLESASAKTLARWRRPGDNAAFRRAVGALRDAGYARSQVGAYVMAGLPGRSAAEVRASIQLARDAGAQPKLNEYSPIPGTREWPRALEASGGELAREPLWHNNNLYHTRPEAFPNEEFEALKRFAREEPGSI